MYVIINKACSYFGRTSSTSDAIKANNWKVIKKELARVNINSMLVTMPIKPDSKLIFPFIVKDKQDNYQLVKNISEEGLVIDEKLVNFEKFEQNYSKELMLLEKAEYIENDIWNIKTIITKNKDAISYLLLSAVIILALLATSDTVGYVFLSFGLLVSFYTKAKENGGTLNSPICINKGIFTCNKTKSYELLGIPFFDMSIMYFLAALLSISFLGLTLLLVIITCIGLCFCIYCLILQVFKEKKICILCILILITYFINTFWIFKNYDSSGFYQISNEVSTILLFVISVFFVILYLSDQELEIRRKALDFDMIMSEWSVISMFCKKNDKEMMDSNIIIGENTSTNIIRLYIHTACKHCPVALREMLNLILLDDGYCFHLYIKSENRDIDIYYFSLIEKAVGDRNYVEIYKIYMNWKSAQKIPLFQLNENKNFRLHGEILEKSKIDFYPTLCIDSIEVSNFPRFENIKISLMK